MTTSGSNLSSIQMHEHAYNRKSVIQKEVTSKKYLINKLNFINFQGKTISCHFVNQHNISTTSIDIMPEPCVGKYLVGLWPDDIDMSFIIEDCVFNELVVPVGRKNIIVEPDIRYINKSGFCLSLPETCILTPSEAYKRNAWTSVVLRLNQGENHVIANLIEFNEHTLTLSIPIVNADAFRKIKRNEHVIIDFIREGADLFSGKYKVVSYVAGDISISVIMEPESHVIHIRRPKKHRSPRYTLTPTAEVFFNHPFNSEFMGMKVVNISGAGFSVESIVDNTLLLTGMIIQNMEINFAGLLKINCNAQVVYRTIVDEGGKEPWLKYGFAFLDMTINDHVELLALLHQIEDSELKVCVKINPDELWNFLFETGFIYQKKYRMFLENKEGIRKTYEKLYLEKPTISRHFTCHDQNRLIGHLSTIKFSDNSWLVHHHAALKSSGIKAGMGVLNHMINYFNDAEWIDNYGIKYLMCYFRPDNPFPNFFFTGFTEQIGNPQISSSDLFAYGYYRKSSVAAEKFGDEWALTEAAQEDLDELSTFYTSLSGGLLLKALGIETLQKSPSQVEKDYHEAGLKKELHLWSLRLNGRLKAVFVVNLSDFGLNMSDLTNCISLFVIDSAGLTKSVTDQMLNRLSTYFEQKRFPVLYYPSDFADEKGIDYQKQYTLWIFNALESDYYFNFIEKIIEMNEENNR